MADARQEVLLIVYVMSVHAHALRVSRIPKRLYMYNHRYITRLYIINFNFNAQSRIIRILKAAKAHLLARILLQDIWLIEQLDINGQ